MKARLMLIGMMAASALPCPAQAPSATHSVIVVWQTNRNLGSVATDSANTNHFTVSNAGDQMLSGTAAMERSDGSFSIISGATYSSGTDQPQVMNIRHQPSPAAKDREAMLFTGGGGSRVYAQGERPNATPGSARIRAEAQTNKSTSALSGRIPFEAPAGALTAPFLVTNGAIVQLSDADITNGGRAVYTFTLTNAGVFVIEALVTAPSETANSFYVNIDAQPQDPGMVWDIQPNTSGFEPRLMSWRGNGTFASNQFAPKQFTLSTGTHQLIVVGREANTQLKGLAIIRLPQAPSDVKLLRR
jgi:hypothetical protein